MLAEIEEVGLAQIQIIAAARNSSLSDLNTSTDGQIDRIKNVASDYTEQQINRIQTASDNVVQNQITSINNAGATKIADIQSAGTAKIADIQSIAATKVTDIQSAGSTKIADIQSAGATQVSTINTAGTAQTDAIQAKGDQVLDNIPEDYTELSNDVTALKADLSDKDALTVGTAKQLVGDKFTEDKAPYLFRQSGGGLTVGNREYLDAVVGGTVVWNQLVKLSNITRTKTVNGITFTNNGDGTINIDGTASQVTYPSIFFVNSLKDHVYLLNGDSKLTIYDGLVGHGKNIARMGDNNPNAPIYVLISEGTTFNNEKYKMQAYDITAMFGTKIADHIYALEQANAGDGVALFKKLFPNDYYEYNPGELISVSGVSAHETVGFNQWDEEWEVGAYNVNTGEAIAGSGQIHSKGFIPVIPSTSYYVKVYTDNSKGGLWIQFYDENKNIISKATTDYNYNNESGKSLNYKNNIMTLNAECHYIKFYCETLYGTTYNHDICINISDPKRNGEYEPYTKRSYPLDSTLTLRGIPKLVDGKVQYDGDRYLPDGTVERRYGVVDLGTLNYARGVSTSTGLTYFDVTIANRKYGVNIICDKFIPVSNYGTAYGQVYTSGRDYFTFYADYPDAATFKSAMSGVMLIYELATSITETAEPYRSDQLLDAGGTEEFVSTSLVPVGHETRYAEDLVKKLESLPWDMSMIAPIETGTTASQAYAVGKYFILNDQFCKAKTAIASGATFTLNTNYEVTTVADELYTALH